MTNPVLPTAAADRKFLLLLTAALVVLLAISFVLRSRAKSHEESLALESRSGEFQVAKLEAKSAYVYDARTKTVLFAHNENTRLPLASLTKVMAALVASQMTSLNSTVTVENDALKTEGDSGLKVGEKWSLGTLLDFSLISSSNDGIHAVALALGGVESGSNEEVVEDFVRMMNRKAGELDLKNTYYWNATGLDESDLKGGAYGTARDMATLLEYAISYYPETFEATRESSLILTSLDNEPHLAKNTNALAAAIPGLLASKTGYTDTAGGNLIFAFDPELGRPIIVTILGSTAEGRFEDAQKLVNATLTYLNSQ